jgi:hypothetical protein
MTLSLTVLFHSHVEIGLKFTLFNLVFREFVYTDGVVESCRIMEKQSQSQNPRGRNTQKVAFLLIFWG